MAFLPIALGVGSLLGGVLGLFGKRQKPLTIEELKRFFGPEALSEETLQLFNTILTSPAGQTMMQNASMAGGRLAQNISRRLAGAGLAGGGAESGIGAFAAAAGQESGTVLQGQAKSQMFSDAFQAAMQNIAMRAQLAQAGRMKAMETPSTLEKLGAAISGASSAALAAYKPRTEATPEITAAAPIGGGGYIPMIPRTPLPPLLTSSSSLGLSRGSKLTDSFRRWMGSKYGNPYAPAYGGTR